MDNSFFILSKETVTISRFHICTWDIENENSFVEFGLEFDFPKGLSEINFKLVVPFIFKKNPVRCLLHELIKDSNNSKFVFNDNIQTFIPIGGDKRNGSVIEFETRDKMSILPIEDILITEKDKSISWHIKNPQGGVSTLSYARLLIKSSERTLATVNKGIAQKRLIYDIKLNEKRNLPDNVYKVIRDKYAICEVKNCFCFHVIPNSFNISFIDQNKLKNIRELEVPAFRDYLEEAGKMKDNKYTIIFNKSQNPAESYSFFTILNKEIIGTKQVLSAVAINILCSLLFAFSSLRSNIEPSKSIWEQIPTEYWIALSLIALSILILFIPFKSIISKYI